MNVKKSQYLRALEKKYDAKFSEEREKQNTGF